MATQLPPIPRAFPAASREAARVEDQLRRGKEEWESTVDAVPELIFLTDIEGRVLRCNRAAAAFVCRDFAAVLGQDLKALLAPRAPRDLAALAADSSEIVCDAPPTVLEVARHPVSRRGASPTVVYVMRDVTELRRLESIAANVDMMNNLGHVLGVVRHEVGNPVNAIKTALAVLLERFDDFDKSKQRSYVQRCLDDVARVQHLLEQLRGFTMFEEIVPTSVDLTAFLSELEPWLRASTEHDGISLAINLPKRRCTVLADTRALRQVLLGLMANAKDALTECDAPRIELAVSDHPSDACVSVTDNGRGIAEEDLPRVFLPLFTTKPRGTGLGLAVARTMVTRMKGVLELTSRPGQGTRAEIVLLKPSPTC